MCRSNDAGIAVSNVVKTTLGLAVPRAHPTTTVDTWRVTPLPVTGTDRTNPAVCGIRLFGLMALAVAVPTVYPLPKEFWSCALVAGSANAAVRHAGTFGSVMDA